jgi:acyl-CoA synthetase (AMP-forming)/AMP-acid ligase II
LAKRAFWRLDEDGVTHLALVPTMLDMVLEATERDLRMLERIRSIGYGAAPITEPLLRRLIQACPNARIQQFYGMTECCGASAILSAERHVLEGPMAGKLRAAGQPIPGTEIRIADPDMRECARGKTGEILMRGPGVMRGYAKDSERSRESLVGGWLRSGDLGRIDKDGYLFVQDRLKDMIISGGENIYSAEVENALGSYPGVDGCAVIGLPDDRWGERVHAVVVRKPRYTLDERELDKHCRSLIAGYKVPRSYDIRANPLPLSGVGKVQKHELRSEWLSRQAWNRALGGSG